MNQTKVPENKAYKVTLILLLGLAAFTTAVKELNRLHTMVSSVHEFTRQWRGTDWVTPNEKPASTEQTVLTIELCANDKPSVINSSAEAGLSERIAAATDGYFESMECEAGTEPEVGARVDWLAGKRLNRYSPKLGRTKSVPATNLKEEIASIRRDSNWPTRFEYRTPDRRVTPELPMTMVADIKGDAIENEFPTGFILGVLSKIDRKQSPGKTETRRRELMIKRFERNISSRRAS